jgi:hypothetical protein
MLTPCWPEFARPNSASINSFTSADESISRITTRTFPPQRTYLVHNRLHSSPALPPDCILLCRYVQLRPSRASGQASLLEIAPSLPNLKPPTTSPTLTSSLHAFVSLLTAREFRPHEFRYHSTVRHRSGKSCCRLGRPTRDHASAYAQK